MASDQDGKVMAFLFGAAAGGILALLYAPRSGEETRQRLRRRAEDLYEQGDEMVRNVTAEARTRSAEVSEKVREQAGEVQERMRETAENLSRTARTQAEAVKEAAAEAKRAYQESAGREEPEAEQG